MPFSTVFMKSFSIVSIPSTTPSLAAISVPYYKYICSYGIDKFVRFAKNVWGINTVGMTKEQAALAGIESLSDFIETLGLPRTLRELGATKEMLPKIADSTVLGGGYKILTSEDVLNILKEAF